MGGYKHYQNPFSFTCCVGSGMETNSKYGGIIYYHGKNELYVNQFIASEVQWTEKGLIIRQETNFPETQNTRLIIQADKSKRFALKIRYPYWAEKGITVRVNGEEIKVDSSPSSFVSIERLWNPGDRVEVEFPFTIHSVPMPDDSNRLALMYGPLVLASDLGTVDDTQAKDPAYVPVILTEESDPAHWLKSLNEPNNFETVNVGSPRNVTFKPFYATHDRRYSVYHDKFTQSELDDYMAEQKAEEGRKRKLEELTYDQFVPGDNKSEQVHSFEGDSVYIETFKGKTARVANRGGRFSFEMKVLKGQPMALVAEYWGGYTGSKTFDILVNGEKIATENISGKRDGHFIDVQYDLPERLTAGVSKIKVEYSPHIGNRAGPLFGMRTIIK